MLDTARIRDAADIVKIIGQYMPLKAKGKSLWGSCLFHKEKTASFHVMPHWRTYKCFGCGARGDVFTFVQAVESVSFPEAVRIVAGMAGVPIDDTVQTAESAVEKNVKRTKAQHIAADMAHFQRRLIDALVKERNEIYRTTQAYDRWAVAHIMDEQDSPAWACWPLIYSLGIYADKLDAQITELRQAAPDSWLPAYSQYQKDFPSMEKRIAERLEDAAHSRAVAEAVIAMLAA